MANPAYVGCFPLVQREGTMNISHARRLAAAIAVPALAAAAIVAGTTTSYADPTPSGSAGSNWLVGQVGDDDLIFNDQFEFTDYGLSIDVAFAAAAAKVDSGRANAISAAVAANIESYITGEDFGDTGSTYAGPTAKALVLAQRTEGDATDFGGINLVTRLESVVSSGPLTKGRLEDVSTFGDNANAIGQSFAVDGLSGAGSARAGDVTDYLLKQQCSAGFFRLSFSAKVAPDQSCDAAVPAARPDTDTTAIAVVALQSRPNDPAAVAAVAKGVAWLKANQATNGSFGGVAAGPNANSTGLAAAALGSRCEVVAADRAADRLRDLQVDAADAGNALAGDMGAIAYDAEALRTGRNEGITTETRDQFRRASAQAIPGLLFETAGTPTVSFGLTPKFGRVGRTETLRIRGVAAGETVCFGDVLSFRPILGTGGQIKVDVSQDTEGKMRYGITTGPGIANERIKFLDKTRFDVNVLSQVSRGDKQAVAISGLERGEKVRVFVKGERVAKGKANARGKYFTRFDVTSNPGRTRVKVIGQFFNRKGFEPFRVNR